MLACGTEPWRLKFEGLCILSQEHHYLRTKSQQTFLLFRDLGSTSANFSCCPRTSAALACDNVGISYSVCVCAMLNFWRDLQASTRFKEVDFVEAVLEAVHELDKIFTDMGYAGDPWRPDEVVNRRGGVGEISLNLVDLMEFLNLQNNGHMDAMQRGIAEAAFKRWKDDAAFRKRVVGILTEEGRGRANYKDFVACSRGGTCISGNPCRICCELQGGLIWEEMQL